MKLHATVIALGVVSLLNDVASDMVMPFLPAFLTVVLGTGPLMLGWVEGVAEATASLVNLWSGVLADRFSRRKPLAVGGYAVSALARWGIAFVGAGWQVIAVRFADRVGKGLRSAPRDALIADVTPADMRGLAFGFHRGMDHLGALIGPLLAFLLVWKVGLDVRAVFFWAIVPGLAAVLVALLVVREEPRRDPPAVRTLSLGSLPAGRLRSYLLLLAVFTLANSSDAFLILRAQELGMAIAFAPLLSALLHVVKAAAAVPGGWLSDRVGRPPLLAAGWALYALLYWGFGRVDSLAVFWGLVAVYGLYFGLTEGVAKAWVADLVPADRRGIAYGWYHASLGVAALPSSVIFGWIWQAHGSAAAFTVGSGLSAAAALGMLLLWRAGRDPAC